MGVKVREKDKGSGIWYIFIDHHGKRRAKKIGDKKAAQEAAKALSAKLALGDLGVLEEEIKTPLFKEYAEHWLHIYIKALRRHSTFVRYRDILKTYVYPALGKNCLDEIKRVDIRNLILKLHKGGLSKSSVCLVRDVISGSMSYAVDEELIPVNPAIGIIKKLQLERDKKISIKPLNLKEVQVFLDACTKHYPEHYPFFLCAFRTGMRLGELLAVKWSDIDWHGKFIRVSRSYKTGRVEPTKTGRVRHIDMSDQLADTLKKLLTARKEEALRDGSGEVTEVIFHHNGKYMEQNHIRKIFKRLLTKAGLRELRVHDIRHTMASLLLSDGASPVYVKEQLGHTSIQMTVDIYGHLIPSSNRGAINKLDSPQSATQPQPAQKQMA
ncbi:MAG: tyrosine-type recombinase/integrase [Syntrophobacteraceae bacterium]